MTRELTNDTLMRDATYREIVAAKLMSEAYPDSDLPDDQQVDTAVSFADALIRKLNETAEPEASVQAPLYKPKPEDLTCTVSSRGGTERSKPQVTMVMRAKNRPDPVFTMIVEGGSLVAAENAAHDMMRMVQQTFGVAPEDWEVAR